MTKPRVSLVRIDETEFLFYFPDSEQKVGEKFISRNQLPELLREAFPEEHTDRLALLMKIMSLSISEFCVLESHPTPSALKNMALDNCWASRGEE